MAADADIEVPVSASVSDSAVRCGVDVVSIDRIDGVLTEFGKSFKNRVFRPFEQEYCDRQADPPQHYAARWAAKEAFVKAIVADAQPVPFREVGVSRTGSQPSLSLTGRAATALKRTMAGEDSAAVDTTVSLSHDRHAGQAIGQVVFFRRPGR